MATLTGFSCQRSDIVSLTSVPSDLFPFFFSQIPVLFTLLPTVFFVLPHILLFSLISSYIPSLFSMSSLFPLIFRVYSADLIDSNT